MNNQSMHMCESMLQEHYINISDIENGHVIYLGVSVTYDIRI